MSNDAQHVVFKQLNDGQDKYTYYMLTAAGGAVALAVNQTHGAGLEWAQIPLGLAVLMWGISVFCGARRLMYVNAVLFANLDLLRVESGNHPEAQELWKIHAASEGIRSAAASNSKKAGGFAMAQFRFLVAGSVLYVVWHVTEMWLRTIRPA
jgi:hypothetical protein